MKNILKLIMITLFATLAVNLYACNNGEDDSERLAGDGTDVVVADPATPAGGAGAATQ